ncbi:MAG: PAS domain-containing protein [Steroidobacteraceae bacterium]|nr:PAS domain-containing protein [Steroidobacteraceae bacterium]
MSSQPKIPPEDTKPESASAERRNLADALAHERNVLRTMIDLLPAFIYTKDAHSRFTACNKLVANRMGLEPDDLIGKTDFDFFPREMAERFFADEQALIKSGKPLIDHEEAAFDKMRGQDRIILTSKVPLHDANGNLTGIVGTGFDITDRKAAENRMASSDRLESIGRLAAGVAHDINTPIQYLNDSVTFIREGVRELLECIDALRAQIPTPPEPDENIEELRKDMPPALELMADGLMRIAETVRSMKDFANADPSAMASVDLNRKIASTLVVARSEYQEVADVQTDFAPLPPISCNSGLINQVILNLIVNAAHAIADVVGNSGKRGRITVRTAVDGDDVVISLTDTGGGIPEDIRSRIYDPFFSTKQVGRGTGQGLSIAHNVVVKGHGGKIHFESQMGRGTTFHVRLPISRAGDPVAGVLGA